jgi:hypothetical protein
MDIYIFTKDPRIECHAYFQLVNLTKMIYLTMRSNQNE